jgi:hypothetical protein
VTLVLALTGAAGAEEGAVVAASTSEQRPGGALNRVGAQIRIVGKYPLGFIGTACDHHYCHKWFVKMQTLSKL